MPDYVLAALTAIAVLEFALFRLHLRQLRTLSRVESPDLAEWPTVSVIVPARDEADTIGPALASRLADDYPALEVIVVDDRSTDRTSEAAAAAAGEDPRVRIVRVDTLPDGWLGKVNAMRAGSELASGDWLLFSDADVHVVPGALRRAVSACEHDGTDMLALIPEYELRSVWVAAAWAVFMRIVDMVLAPDAIRDPDSKAALGSGAFNLVRRSAFDASPGFEWLRLETADDMALAMMMKRSGARIDIMDGHGSARVDIYPNVRAMFRGIEKNGGTSAAHPWRFTLGMALFLIAEWAPLIALTVGVSRGVAWLAAVGLATAVVATCANVQALRLNTGSWAPALLWPVGSLLIVAGTVRATWLVHARGGVMWRGTFHPLDEIHDARRYEL